MTKNTVSGYVKVMFFFNLGTHTARTLILRSLVNKTPGTVVAKLFWYFILMHKKLECF